MLGLSINTLTTDDKYSHLNRENLTQPIQMHLSKKQKLFYQCFSAFLKFKSNFEHFEKNMTIIAYVISEIRTTEDEVRICKKSRLLGP